MAGIVYARILDPAILDPAQPLVYVMAAIHTLTALGTPSLDID